MSDESAAVPEQDPPRLSSDPDPDPEQDVATDAAPGVGTPEETHSQDAPLPAQHRCDRR